MRRVRNMNVVRVFVLAVALAFIVSCATFRQNTYNTLYTAGVAYDTAMSVAGDVYKLGKITETQKAEITKYADPFYSAYHASVDAFEAWNKVQTVENKDKMIIAFNTMLAKAASLKDYLNRLNVRAFDAVLDKLAELSELVKTMK